MVSKVNKILNQPRDHAFWAFMWLMTGIMVLMAMAQFWEPASSADAVIQGKLNLIDKTITGLIALAGVAANALFRRDATDKLEAQTENLLANKVPPPTVGGEYVQDLPKEDSTKRTST